MKLYLNEEKTNIDPHPHNYVQLGLDSNDQDHCDRDHIHVKIYA